MYSPVVKIKAGGKDLRKVESRARLPRVSLNANKLTVEQEVEERIHCSFSASLFGNVKFWSECFLVYKTLWKPEVEVYCLHDYSNV